MEHAASLAATGVPAIVAAFRVVGKEVSGLHKLRVGGCVIGRCKTKAFKNQVYNCKPNDRQKKKKPNAYYYCFGEVVNRKSQRGAKQATQMKI